MTETKNIKPLEDFDWEAFEHGKNPANIAEETKAYEGTLNNVNDNEVVDGTVTALNDREVVVNIGYKSDGRNRKGIHQVPHQGGYDCRHSRNRSIPPRKPDRREAYPRL